jgi:aminoglycoside phosphotransferase (APT) family kinase protein
VLEDERVRIVDRTLHHYASSFRGEVVRCRTAEGRELPLYCKYGAGPVLPERGVRGGVRYEAEVYRCILLPLRVSVPHFYGAHQDAETGLTWLLLGLVDGRRISMVRDVVAAARWLGDFHARGEALARGTEAGFLARYDAELLSGFARRTLEFIRPRSKRYPWLPTVCERFERELLGALVDEPVIIHGEYYRHNVLYRRGEIFPVDWESAALAAGEIDLAHLVEAWPPRVVASALLAYCEARWPAGASPEFERRLEVARLYVHFRWLGDREDWAGEEDSGWRLADMRPVAERLGLV